MPRSRIGYQHFCPAARALEVIGEKWSLLVVRDLLAGPRRFSDLRRSLTAITPKGLSARLRALEEEGVIEREAASPREVWYRLTARGMDLAAVIRAMNTWGQKWLQVPVSPKELVNSRKDARPKRTVIPLATEW